MWLEQSKGVREKGKKDRKFISTYGTRTHDLLLSGQAHYHCVHCTCEVVVVETSCAMSDWLTSRPGGCFAGRCGSLILSCTCIYSKKVEESN